MIKIDKEKISVKGQYKTILAEYASIVTHLRNDFDEEDIIRATAIGLKTYEEISGI